MTNQGQNKGFNFVTRGTSNMQPHEKVRVTGVQIPTPSMRFLNTFLNFSKFISSLKAQVCNILKNHIDIQIFLLNTDF
jgi:hypothetical protein